MVASSKILEANSGTPLYSEQHNQLSSKSKFFVSACIVTGVAGGALIILGGLNIFELGRGIAFTATMAAGGSLICLAAGGILWIFCPRHNNQQETLEANIQELPLSSNDPITKNQLTKSTSCSPVDPAKQRKYLESREQFFKAAEARLRREALPVFKLPDCQNPSFIEASEDAIREIERRINGAITTFGGGEHRCVTTDKIPSVLFKQKRDYTAPPMSEYVEQADGGRKICEDNDSYLLYIPKCQAIKSDIVMEEKVELLDGGLEAQKSAYLWILYDPQLQTYAKALFKQLLIFTCLLDFADLKYDNISLTKDGRVALYDLDRRGAIFGLIGCDDDDDKKDEGLFNIIPLAWFDDFVALAKVYLSSEDFAKLQSKLTELIERAKEREAVIEACKRLYHDKGITHPAQPLVFDKRKFSHYEKDVALFAEKAIEHLNHQIKILPHLSLIGGRTIRIDTNSSDPFYKDLGFEYQRLKQTKEKGLEALKEQGYILSYHVHEFHPFFAVIC